MSVRAKQPTQTALLLESANIWAEALNSNRVWSRQFIFYRFWRGGAGKREESGELIKKEWLPLSLDLNPTEKVWDLLYLSKKRT